MTNIFMIIKQNFPLKKFTTMAMGGPAKFFLIVKSELELPDALKFAKEKRLPWYAVGEGSNLIAADSDFRGVIIQNKIQRFDLSPGLSPSPGERNSKKSPLQVKEKGRGRNASIIVGSGNNLQETIFRLNRQCLSGLERMAGIPGTIGGAIYGCAGAYGQEIKDHLVKVRIWNGRRFRYLNKKQCQFGYRESTFKKHKNWIITEAKFEFKTSKRSVMPYLPARLGGIRHPGNLDSGSKAGMTRDELSKISRVIIKLRAKKYRPGIKCPGSFFKNIKISNIHPLALRKEFVKKIGSDKIKYDKVPTGYLLEQVNAKGMRQGSIRVASHHANLIYNPNGGKAADVRKLAKKLKNVVKKKFGIIIEEEVQYLDQI